MKKTILITAAALTGVVGYYLPVPQIKAPIDFALNKITGASSEVEQKFLKEDSCAVQITGTLEEKPKCLTKEK